MTAPTPAAPAPTAGSHIETEADDVIAVLRQFRLVFNAIKAHHQQQERHADVTGAQVWALHLIQSQPGMGVNELARHMSVRQPTASILVRALTGLGLVRSERTAEDRRAVSLRLTDEGEKRLSRAPGPHQGLLPKALAAMDPQQLRALRTPLDALVRELGIDAGMGDIPLASTETRTQRRRLASSPSTHPGDAT